jgi:orotate phosphoribosyltransferase
MKPLRKIKRALAERHKRIQNASSRSAAEEMFMWAWNTYRKTKKSLYTSENPAIARAILSMKDMERSLVSGHPTFVSFGELVQWTMEWTDRLPQVDLVVAVPRSGLLVGSIIALRRAIALTTPERDATSVWVSRHIEQRDIRRILLVDDSIATGRALREAYASVKTNYPDAQIMTAALIATGDSRRKVDYCGMVIESPRIFEWNVMHVKRGVVAFDLDGVLAEEPAPGLRKDDARYRSWITNAAVHLIPNYSIDVIISNRPQYVRAETEAWLRSHGVRYERLELAPNDIGQSGKHEHKVSILREIKADLFIESSPSEAESIAKETHIPVLCIGNRRLYHS